MPCGKTVALIFVQTINTSAADLRSLQAAIELSRSMKVDLHPPTFPDNFKSTIAECSHLPSSGVCAAFDSEAEVGFSQHTMTGKFLDAQSSTDYEKQLSQRFLFVGCRLACSRAFTQALSWAETESRLKPAHAPQQAWPCASHGIAAPPLRLLRGPRTFTNQIQLHLRGKRAAITVPCHSASRSRAPALFRQCESWIHGQLFRA